MIDGKLAAILVEDQMDFAKVATEVLAACGFDVHLLESRDDVENFLATATELDSYELVVADRAIPQSLGEDPEEGIGDESFARMYDRLRDTAFVLISGFADFEQVQAALDLGVRSFVLNSDTTIYGVKPFRKRQLVEFRRYVERISAALESVRDVELEGAGSLGDHAKRLLQRLAEQEGAVALTYQALNDGNSSAIVGLSTLLDSNRMPIGRYVVKMSELPFKTSPGGIAALLGAEFVATSVGQVHGLSGNRGLRYFSFAGEAVGSLMATIGQDAEAAAEVTRNLRTAYERSVAPNSRVVTVKEAVEYLCTWDLVVSRGAALGTDLPPASRQVTINFAPQHGDLHAANVLHSGHHPVLIDLDSQKHAAFSTDPIWLLLGSFFQPTSALRDSDVSPETLIDLITDPSSFAGSAWLKESATWAEASSYSERERWTVVLAICARFLGYADVDSHPATLARAQELFVHAAQQLRI